MSLTHFRRSRTSPSRAVLFHYRHSLVQRECCAVQDVSDFDAKHPIILDGRHLFVELFLHHLHALYCHQGSDYVRAQLQQRFFILRIRSLLQSVKSDCFVCRKREAETLTPMMADLPIERLGYRLRPFSN